MKFIHTSDLHIGKRLKNLSLTDDQRYILKQIIDIAIEEKADAVIVAGDVYDRSVPSTEGIKLLDDFLNALAEVKIPLLLVSGNHDSPERLDFGSRLIEKSGVYISGQYDGSIKMKEIDGVEFYLLPFIKPSMIKHYFPEEEIESYEQAVRLVLRDIEPSEKSVIIAHQTVTCSGQGPQRCESDRTYIGGEESVDYSVFDKFSYAALGHIHSSQCVGRETVRYSGTPIKYSKSEALHTKSVLVVEINDDVKITERELTPLRDLRVIKGELDELLKEEVYSLGNTDDYIYAELTDETVEPNYISRIAAVYPNYVNVEMDYGIDEYESELDFGFEMQDPVELFREFFEKQNRREMTQEEFEIIKMYLGGDEE